MTITKVVEDESSCIGDPDLEMKRHIAKDHQDMVRFSGDNDPEYQKAQSALRFIYDRLQGSSDSPPQATGLSLAHPPGINAPIAAEVLAQRQELIDLLYFDEIDSRLLSLKAAHNKTCLWFLEKEEYRQWLELQNLERHNGFLWIKGKPGSGKSILMKFLESSTRRSISNDPNRLLISFFFYAPGERLETSTLGLYRSLLWQLFRQAPDLQHVLDEFDFSARCFIKRSGWQSEVLKETIERAIGRLGAGDLSVFIDALDECRDDDVADMVSFFEDLGERAAEANIRLRICFSSRHYPSIELKCGFEIILEDQGEHSEDIAKYISSKLKLPKSKRAEEFRNQILEKSAGIFLWVALVIPMLNKTCAGGRVDQLQRSLNTIPMGLDNLFDMILARDNEDMDELRFCIQLILFAIRPVTLKEYFFALRPAGDNDLHDSWAAGEVDRDAMVRFVLSSSKGLAEVTKTRREDKDPTVQFIHESVRDFLFSENGQRRLWPSFNQNEFAASGHDALKSRCWGEIEAYRTRGAQEGSKSTEDLIQTWPFLRYATDNVLPHANLAQGYGASQVKFLAQFSERQKDWVNLYNAHEKFKARHYDDKVDMLYILAEHGLDKLLEIHDRLSSHLKIYGGRYFLPLAAAAILKHRAAARVLVASLSRDRDFAAGIEDCVTALSRGRNCTLTSLEDFFELLKELGHIPLMKHCLDSLRWRVQPRTLGMRMDLEPLGKVSRVAFSPDRQMLALSTEDGLIGLCDIATMTCRQTLKGHSDGVNGLAFSPDGKTLASASRDHTVRLWDIATGTCRQTLEGHSKWVWSVAFSPPDGQTLASYSVDCTVRLWDVATSTTCWQALKEQSEYFSKVAFLPDGQTAASAPRDVMARLPDVATGTVWRRLQGHRLPVILAVAFSLDCRTLASASFGLTIRFWDVATGTWWDTLERHPGWVSALAFLEDGQTLASASRDGTVRLWNVATGICLQTLESKGPFKFLALAFSRDGQTIVSVSENGTVQFWELATWKDLPPSPDAAS